MSLRISD